MSHRSSAGAPTPTPWMPESWEAFGADEQPRDEPGHAADAFVAGWAAAPMAPAPAAAPAESAAAFDALPDFSAAHRRTLAADDRAWAALVAEAADEREAQVRAELDEAYAAEWAAQQDAHAQALEEAWAAGHAAGREAGEADAHAALATVAAAFDAAAGEVRAHEERWAGDLRAHVAALAVAVAHHVVGREVAADDALVVTLAARAIAEFPAHEALVARVHPEDLDALKAAWDAAARAGVVRWAPDARVARGGALVEGRERIVDGRVDAALERLYRAIGGHAA